MDRPPPHGPGSQPRLCAGRRQLERAQLGGVVRLFTGRAAGRCSARSAGARAGARRVEKSSDGDIGSRLHIKFLASLRLVLPPLDLFLRTMDRDQSISPSLPSHSRISSLAIFFLASLVRLLRCNAPQLIDSTFLTLHPACAQRAVEQTGEPSSAVVAAGAAAAPSASTREGVLVSD